MKHRKQNRRRRINHKRSSYDRDRQVFLEKIMIGVVVLLAVILIGKLFLGRNRNVEEAVNESVASESETEQEENVQTAETEEISIAAEIGEMNDAEDPQAYENDQQESDGDVSTDEVLKQKNEFEESGVSYGVDVAKWQGTVDWAKVKEAGVEFAMIRVGYRTVKTGVICEDPCAKYNLQQAQAAGLKLGVYFFSTAVNEQEAKEEAAWVSGFIAQYPITYPVAYNCEGFLSSESRQYNSSNDERTKYAIAFLDYIAAKGYTPMFYAAKNEMEDNADWNMTRLQEKYKVWVSQYPDVPYPETPKSSYSGTHAMWQYTSRGVVPGIGTGADMNVAYFGYSQSAQAKDSTPPEAVQADPEALIRFTEVDESVTAKIETNLRSVPSTSDDATIVAKIKNGDVVQRTGIGHNGWSRVIYNGQKLYAVSNYLTTDTSYKAPEANNSQQAEQNTSEQTENSEKAAETAPVTSENTASANSIYKSVNESVTAKNTTNLRSEAGSTSPDTIVGMLKYGEAVIRTGIGSNGWSRLSYNGQTVYAISSYLTTDGNYKENNTPSLANPEAGITFSQVNEAVTAKIETNLRNLPTTSDPSSVVAALKNGETVTRTGIGSNGWSRLSYNGQTVYAVSNYLVVAQ